MASLQIRNGSWRVIYRYSGEQHFVTIGEADESEAQGVKARYEYLLRLLKQRLLSLPPGMDIVSFLRHDGKPAEIKSQSRSPDISFVRFRDGYLKTVGNGSVESNTLYTAKIHLTAELNNPVACNARGRESAGGRRPSLGRGTSLVS